MIKRRFNLVYIVFCLLLLTFLVSANGLTITENSDIKLNKTINQDITVTFKLKNEEPFTFYNITLSDETEAKIGRIDKIDSGEEKVITMIVTTNTDLSNIQLRVIGFYYSNLGRPNNTYEVDVRYNEGLSVCDMSIVEGDKVIWNNLVNGDIILRNSDTGNDVTTILKNTSYKSIFDSPQTFRYHFLRMGYQFTDVCQISVLDDTGLINNPDYDDFITLSVDVEYLPTTMNKINTKNNYSMTFLGEQEGVLSLTNTGSNLAKNVFLSGGWFDFSVNNFDLEPGYTKNVPYTIRIYPRLTNSSQTDMWYKKNVTITGNFDTLQEEFDIFVEYANINEFTNSSEDLQEFVKAFCKANPEVCDIEPEIVYKIINGSDSSINVSVGYEVLKGVLGGIIESMDSNDIKYNRLVEDMSTLIEKMQNLEANGQLTKDKISKIEENSTSNKDVFISIIIIGVTIVASATIIVIIIIKRREMKILKANQFRS